MNIYTYCGVWCHTLCSCITLNKNEKSVEFLKLDLFLSLIKRHNPLQWRWGKPGKEIVNLDERRLPELRTNQAVEPPTSAWPKASDIADRPSFNA